MSRTHPTSTLFTYTTLFRSDGDQSFLGFAGIVFDFTACARSDFEHFGRGDAFGVGQIGGGDECAAQRNGEEDAEDAAADADQKGLPEWESGPPSDDDEAGQHEDDRGERAGGGGDGLDDVVFENRGVFDDAEDRHGDDGGGDGGGEGEADFETEVDVGRGEERGDEHTEHEPADGEFFGFHYG